MCQSLSELFKRYSDGMLCCSQTGGLDCEICPYYELADFEDANKTCISLMQDDGTKLERVMHVLDEVRKS